MLAAQQHGHVGTAVGPVRAARATAVQDRARYIVAIGDPDQEPPDGLIGLGIEL